MSDRKHEKHTAIDAYEAIADRFDEHARNSAFNTYCERPAMLSMLPSLKGIQALDAGCGSGFYSEWLIGHGAQVVAVDASFNMVELTRKKLGESVDIRQWDLRKPFDFLEVGSQDLVLCPLVLDHIEDLKSVFAEFGRVLRESGLLIFSTSHPVIDHMKYGKDYFATELIENESPNFGVVIPYYRRPLSATFDALRETDFVMEHLIEARPTDECKRKYPETYEKLSKRPSFLCIRARKKEDKYE